MNKKKIVVSGINLFQGGTLRVYLNFCDEILRTGLNKEYSFTLFVHKKELFDEFKNDFEIIELPKSRNNWIYRMYYEYIYFHKYSKNKNIDLWISIHDCTPRVVAKHQITYFHNSIFSYKASYKDWKYSKTIFIFSLFYKYVYRWNVHANDHVIVQQDWMADSISKLLPYDYNRIIVLPAVHKIDKKKILPTKKLEPVTFFYPSVSRNFKNFEIICEATKLLNQRIDPKSYQVILTIDGSENRYSRDIVDIYKEISNIHFVGLLSLDTTYEYYQKCSFLIFPSKLESWGLPISEAKEFNLPMIVSDLSYAHETVGNYDKVCFFDPNNALELANDMQLAIENKPIFKQTTYTNTSPNVYHSWKEIIKKII